VGRQSVKWAALGQRLCDPAVVLQIALGVAIAVGFSWGLPGSDSWMADAISPRSCGLGAIAETYLPGHYHKYPPLHMALLTLLSLPWMGLAASRVGTGIGALGAELIKPLYMTGIEVSARLVAAAMAIATLRFTMDHWGRLGGARARIAAGAVLATNAIFVLYAHTGNTDVPYLFWLTWAMLELDRVACGEPREMRALLLATAAVLTKDQAAAALILPLPTYLVIVPWLSRKASPTRPAVVKAALVSIGLYAVVSGAAVNPVGFRHRIAHLFGPASQGWTEYPPGFAGALAMTRDALLRVTDFTSWPIVLAALLGVAAAVGRGPGLNRARRLLPLMASASFAYFFTLPVRQSEHRYFLAETIFFLPYAGLAFDAACERWPRARGSIAIGGLASLAPAVLGVASMDATLLADPRYEAERFLAGLAAGTHVEVYGGPIFMPRIPAQLVTVRPGIEPIEERQAIPGVTDVVDPKMDPRPRAPEVIVLATELSTEPAFAPTTWTTPPETMQYRDPVSRALLRGLADGSLGYSRRLRETCSLPFPLECRRIHHSTGGEVWIYVPPSPSPAAAAPEPPLHVVAEGWEGGPEVGSQFELCPVEGAVFACGGVAPDILRDEGFVRDPSLAAGLPGDRFVYTMVGHWPDATWLVDASPDSGNRSFAVYRWEAATWVRVLDVPQGSTSLWMQVAAWHGGAFARVRDPDNPGRSSLVRLEGGPVPSFASSPPGASREKCDQGPGLIPDVALWTATNGDLYGSGRACPPSFDPLVERWTTSTTPEILHIPTHGCSVPGLSAVGAGVAAYGWCGEALHTPYVTVFDGQSWADVAVPEVAGTADDYARNDEGEWLLVSRPDGNAAGQLMRRRRGAEWEPVTLPASLFYDDPKGVRPERVLTVGSDAWITGHIEHGDGEAAVVFRTRAVEHVLHHP
jgi:hypothetical protein